MYVQPKSNHEKSITNYLFELGNNYLRLPGILSSLVDALQRKRRGPRLPQSCGHSRPAAKAVK